MDTALSIAQALLAAIFAHHRHRQAHPAARDRWPPGRCSWAADVTDAQFRTIGALEVLAAVALVAGRGARRPDPHRARRHRARAHHGRRDRDARTARRDGAPRRAGRAARRLAVRRGLSARSMTVVLDRPRTAATTISTALERVPARGPRPAGQHVRRARPRRRDVAGAAGDLLPARCRALGSAVDADVRRARRRRAPRSRRCLPASACGGATPWRSSRSTAAS